MKAALLPKLCRAWLRKLLARLTSWIWEAERPEAVQAAMAAATAQAIDRAATLTQSQYELDRLPRAPDQSEVVSTDPAPVAIAVSDQAMAVNSAAMASVNAPNGRWGSTKSMRLASVLCWLMVMAAVVWLLVSYQGEREEARRQRAKANANLLAARMQATIKPTVRLLLELSQPARAVYLTGAGLGTLLRPATTPGYTAEATGALAAVQKRSPDLLDVAYADLHGKVVYANIEEVKGLTIDFLLPSIKPSEKNNEVAVSDLFTLPISKRRVIALSRPVLTPQGEAVGFAVALVAQRTIEKWLSPLEIGKQGIAWVGLAANDRILARQPTQSRSLKVGDSWNAPWGSDNHGSDLYVADLGYPDKTVRDTYIHYPAEAPFFLAVGVSRVNSSWRAGDHLAELAALIVGLMLLQLVLLRRLRSTQPAPVAPSLPAMPAAMVAIDATLPIAAAPTPLPAVASPDLPTTATALAAASSPPLPLSQSAATPMAAATAVDSLLSTTLDASAPALPQPHSPPDTESAPALATTASTLAASVPTASSPGVGSRLAHTALNVYQQMLDTVTQATHLSNLGSQPRPTNSEPVRSDTAPRLPLIQFQGRPSEVAVSQFMHHSAAEGQDDSQRFSLRPTQLVVRIGRPELAQETARVAALTKAVSPPSGPEQRPIAERPSEPQPASVVVDPLVGSAQASEAVKEPAPLPVAEAVETALAPWDSRALLQGSSILLADDNAVTRQVMTGMLEWLGCRVSHAVDGQEALDMIEHKIFDAVLMDVRMPRLDGLAATRCIRAMLGSSGKIPVIGLVGEQYRDDEGKLCLAAGMDGFVGKTIDLNQLGQALSRFIKPIEDDQLRRLLEHRILISQSQATTQLH